MAHMKIKFLIFFIFITLSSAFAQTSLTESQWRLSLDVIQAKAKQLVILNHELTSKNTGLKEAIGKISNSVTQLGEKNQKMKDFLRQRNGKTDQHIQLEEIAQNIKLRQVQLQAHQDDIDGLNKQLMDAQRKVNVKRLRIAEWEIRKKSQEVELDYKKQIYASQVPSPEDLNQLRKQLEKEKVNEAALEAKINEYSKSATTQHLDANALRHENSQLQARVETYQKEVIFRRKAASSPKNNDKYQAMLSRKHDLEEKIKAYEARIDMLKNPANFTLSWDKQKKTLIRSMVQADASNQQLKSKIENIKEDIAVLRDQVAKLERRINFGQGKGYRKY